MFDIKNKSLILVSTLRRDLLLRRRDMVLNTGTNSSNQETYGNLAIANYE